MSWKRRMAWLVQRGATPLDWVMLGLVCAQAIGALCVMVTGCL